MASAAFMAAALDLITSATKAGHTTLLDTATSMARKEGVPHQAIHRAIERAHAPAVVEITHA